MVLLHFFICQIETRQIIKDTKIIKQAYRINDFENGQNRGIVVVSRKAILENEREQK